jgi:hypothetical protein
MNSIVRQGDLAVMDVQYYRVCSSIKSPCDMRKAVKKGYYRPSLQLDWLVGLCEAQDLLAKENDIVAKD